MCVLLIYSGKMSLKDVIIWVYIAMSAISPTSGSSVSAIKKNLEKAVIDINNSVNRYLRILAVVRTCPRK